MRAGQKAKKTWNNETERDFPFWGTAVCVFLFCMLMAVFPSVSIKGAKYALSLWLGTVVPALFPFFICVNFMISSGLSKGLGNAVEPVVRKVFCVPGEAAFAFVMSITSGYPVGAKIIAELRQTNRLSRVQAERSLAFCSTSGPLFMLGAVGVGMFASPAAGWVIALSHYAGAVGNGILYGRLFQNDPYDKEEKPCTRVREDRNAGGDNMIMLVTDAILKSAKTLFIIWGYMTLFMILIQAGKVWDIGNSLFFQGFLEMTAGCTAASQLQNITPSAACVLCSAIISWGGLSVQAQSVSFLADTDIRISRYFLTKVTHMFFAVAAAVPLSGLLLPETAAVWRHSGQPWQKGEGDFIYSFLFSTGLLLTALLAFVLLMLLSPAFMPKQCEKRRQRRENRHKKRMLKREEILSKHRIKKQEKQKQREEDDKGK